MDELISKRERRGTTRGELTYARTKEGGGGEFVEMENDIDESEG